MQTCFSCVFHGGLVGRLDAELLQHQLLVLLWDQSLLVRYIHRWLVRRGTFWVRGRPALRPVAPCGNKASRRLGGGKRWQDPKNLLSEIIAPTVRGAHHCWQMGFNMRLQANWEKTMTPSLLAAVSYKLPLQLGELCFIFIAVSAFITTSKLIPTSPYCRE